MVDYKQTILIFWILTVLIVANTFVDKGLTLDFYPNFSTTGIVLAFLITLFIGLQIAQSKVTNETAIAVKDKMKDIYHYLPKSRNEYIWFILLSLSAGICEEIIFRLFMFSFLVENLNLVTAFILTNIVFAITHIGSGKQNLISSFILGLLFTAIYYFTNNIWLPIILHSAIDISAGALGYKTQKLERKLTEESITD